MIGGTNSRQEYRQSSVHLAHMLVAPLALALTGKTPDDGDNLGSSQLIVFLTWLQV